MRVLASSPTLRRSLPATFTPSHTLSRRTSSRHTAVNVSTSGPVLNCDTLSWSRQTSPMLQRRTGRSADVRTFFAGQPVARSTQLATSATVSASPRLQLIAAKLAWS
eukprot:1182250-Prymnesium_polylepis.1